MKRTLQWGLIALILVVIGGTVSSHAAVFFAPWVIALVMGVGLLLPPQGDLPVDQNVAPDQGFAPDENFALPGVMRRPAVRAGSRQKIDWLDSPTSTNDSLGRPFSTDRDLPVELPFQQIMDPDWQPFRHP